MDYVDQDPANCSVGRSLEILAQPWVLLVLREVVRGVDRFATIQSRLGVSRSVLADRLDLLVEHRILEKVPYKEPGRRQRLSYALTPKGKDLVPVLSALRLWGDKYLADPEGPALLAEHRDCGEAVGLMYVCGGGHRFRDPDEVRSRPGPSAHALALGADAD